MVKILSFFFDLYCKIETFFLFVYLGLFDPSEFLSFWAYLVLLGH